MSISSPAEYWEGRARRYAGDGAGLAAVCSYGMPLFYNRSIELTQRLALAPYLDVAPGAEVLDVGCGVGRWSRRLAARGARVTGVDLAPTMLAEAARRAERDGVAERCRFLQADLAELDLGRTFDRIVGVTVLQHVLDEDRLRMALSRLAAHLAAAGRMVLLEAAPTGSVARCDTAVFRARPLASYRAAIAAAGLRIEHLGGVDPMPWKTLYLPYHRRLPTPVGALALAAVTAASLPGDLVFGRRWVRWSWHKVLVVRHGIGSRGED